MSRKIIRIAVLLLLVAGVSGWWFTRASGGRTVAFRTENVVRDDLRATISASGTLEPEDVVDVGAQVVGQIIAFGQDEAKHRPIDYGTEVEPGTVLARIDDKLYKAKVDQSRAMLNSARTKVDQAKAQESSAAAKVDQAKANVLVADANLRLAKARATQSDRDWVRAQQLAPTKVMAPSDVDAAESAFGTNRASVGVSEAALSQAKANVTDAEAALRQATAAIADAEAAVKNAEAQLAQDELNLGYCVITSPIKGVIIDRRVGIGQTVQSSFNTPSLFLLAKDLRRMKVWASVNEADIGQVHVGQPVTFTVDAFAGESFYGTVSLIRLNATMTQQVVTYTVEVTTDNSSGKLLPYLTANLKFQVGERSHTLLVSNEALRWKPTVAQVVPDLRKEYARSQRGGEAGSSAAKPESTSQGTVWVEDNGFVRPVAVQLGLSDGIRTEVLGDALKEGDRVVTGEAVADSGDSAANPFTPQMFGGKKQQ
jgi:HlyD family secretion protein